MGVIYKNGIPYGGGSGSGSSSIDDRVVVSLGAPSVVDTDELLAAYPTGYSYSNSYIESGYVVSNGSKFPLNNNAAVIYMASDGIHGFTLSSAYLNGDFYAILRANPN